MNLCIKQIHNLPNCLSYFQCPITADGMPTYLPCLFQVFGDQQVLPACRFSLSPSEKSPEEVWSGEESAERWRKENSRQVDNRYTLSETADRNPKDYAFILFIVLFVPPNRAWISSRFLDPLGIWCGRVEDCSSPRLSGGFDTDMNHLFRGVRGWRNAGSRLEDRASLIHGK